MEAYSKVRKFIRALIWDTLDKNFDITNKAILLNHN